MTKPFGEVFPKLHLSEDARELMGQSSVSRVTMNTHKDLMSVYLESDVLIHKKYILETN